MLLGHPSSGGGLDEGDLRIGGDLKCTTMRIAFFLVLRSGCCMVGRFPGADLVKQ